MYNDVYIYMYNFTIYIGINPKKKCTRLDLIIINILTQHTYQFASIYLFNN